MEPKYLTLSLDELEKRVDELFERLSSCIICPKNCRVNRLEGKAGICRVKDFPVISSFGPHFGEETVLVGTNGSGTIFFTSCNLSCIYCQNYEISQQRVGDEVSHEELARIMMKLQEMGCHNINLVSPTHQVPMIAKSITIAIRKGLKIPFVYNTNGYDAIETLKLINGFIDIYMPDAKYSNNEIAMKYSNAPNYFEVMKEAIKEMHRQVGILLVNEHGIAERGLLIRHLVLPNNISGAEEIMKFIAEEISKDTFINIMDQYYPCFKAHAYPEISRGISRREFMDAVSLAHKYGLKRLYKE